MTTLTPITPAGAYQRLTAGTAVLIDIREADEYAHVHIAGAHSHPLSGWDSPHLTVAADAPDTDIIFTCRSGMRTAGACDRLAARVHGRAHVLDGGVDAWARAGLPVVRDARAPLEIMRQVQIAAGLLILTGVLLGTFMAPAWFGLSAFVGAGLLFAGVTGFCGMARLLMLAPWNRRAAA